MAENIVRRLTPLECERLQGFPDNWTLIGEPEEVDVRDIAHRYTTEVDANGETQIIDERIKLDTFHKETKYYYTDINGKKKEVTDSERYKALGNSIALPQWWWLMNKLEPYLPENPTMGSLFDGIGGFPLVFEEKYGKGSARWASEIENFPICVTKERF